MANQAFVAWVALETPEADPTPERAYVAWAELELPEAVDFTVALSQAAAAGSAGILEPSSVPVGALPVGDQPWWLAHGGKTAGKRRETDEETAETAVVTDVTEGVTARPSLPSLPSLPQAAGLLADPPLPRKRYAPLRPPKAEQRGRTPPQSFDEDDEEVLLLSL